LLAAVFYTVNSPKLVCRLGSARTRWGSLQCSPDSLAELRGHFVVEKGGGEEREGLSLHSKILATALDL